jgi:hypothetical protein
MPQKDTLDRAAYTCMLVSYRRLSSQFQFSLSGVTLVYCISMLLTLPVLGYSSFPQHLPTSFSLSALLEHFCLSAPNLASAWVQHFYTALSYSASTQRFPIALLHSTFPMCFYTVLPDSTLPQWPPSSLFHIIEYATYVI